MNEKNARIHFASVIPENPGGSIVELKIVSSTTGMPDFDAVIAGKVKRWKFEPVKGEADDIVSFPFTFSPPGR